MVPCAEAGRALVTLSRRIDVATCLLFADVETEFLERAETNTPTSSNSGETQDGCARALRPHLILDLAGGEPRVQIWMTSDTQVSLSPPPPHACRLGSCGPRAEQCSVTSVGTLRQG